MVKEGERTRYECSNAPHNYPRLICNHSLFKTKVDLLPHIARLNAPARFERLPKRQMGVKLAGQRHRDAGINGFCRKSYKFLGLLHAGTESVSGLKISRDCQPYNGFINFANVMPGSYFMLSFSNNDSIAAY